MSSFPFCILGKLLKPPAEMVEFAGNLSVENANSCIFYISKAWFVTSELDMNNV